VSEAQARCPIPKAFRRAFVAAARESRLQVALLVAVAEEESEMNPNARSRKGAIGLLQLMPSTAAELEADATVPRENIRAGARYLRALLTRFGGDVDLALAAYNAGPAAVARADGPPSLETAAYVANVRARAAWHANCRG
jgi:soluble lytic murein transglycosylase-like protein